MPATLTQLHVRLWELINDAQAAWEAEVKAGGLKAPKLAAMTDELRKAQWRMTDGEQQGALELEG